MMDQPALPAHESFAPVAIRLLRGPVYEDDHCWQQLLEQQIPLQKWLGQIGLRLELNQSNGFAHLAQPSADEEEGTEGLPRLMNRATLGYIPSLLCVLLRQELEEFDARSTGNRLFITQGGMKERLALFFPETPNRSKRLSELNEPINRLEKIGILKLNRADEQNPDNTQYEVRRIIKALVSVDQLEAFHQKLTRDDDEPVHE